MTAGHPTPWHEAAAVVRAMHHAAVAAGERGLFDLRPDEVDRWTVELQAQVAEYVDRAKGHDEGDPRAALVGVIAIAGAAVAAMDNAPPVRVIGQ